MGAQAGCAGQAGVDLVIPAGQLTGSQTIAIVDDEIAEPDEVFTIRSSWSAGYEHGAPGQGVIRIIDDDQPGVAFTASSIVSK